MSLIHIYLWLSMDFGWNNDKEWTKLFEHDYSPSNMRFVLSLMPVLQAFICYSLYHFLNFEM